MQFKVDAVPGTSGEDDDLLDQASQHVAGFVLHGRIIEVRSQRRDLAGIELGEVGMQDDRLCLRLGLPQGQEPCLFGLQLAQPLAEGRAVVAILDRGDDPCNPGVNRCQLRGEALVRGRGFGLCRDHFLPELVGECLEQIGRQEGLPDAVQHPRFQFGPANGQAIGAGPGRAPGRAAITVLTGDGEAAAAYAAADKP
ncbi:hypothetical protein WJU17_07005 [Iodidimonas sp. SYSU 1G8]